MIKFDEERYEENLSKAKNDPRCWICNRNLDDLIHEDVSTEESYEKEYKEKLKPYKKGYLDYVICPACQTIISYLIYDYLKDDYKHQSFDDDDIIFWGHFKDKLLEKLKFSIKVEK